MKFRRVFISHLLVVSLMTGIAAAAEDVLILEAPDAQAGMRFGDAVAAVGENILVGAPGPASGSDGSVGHVAYLFAPDGTLLETFRAPDTEGLYRFGSSVAGVDDKVFIGAAGRVYVFALDGSHLRTFRQPEVARPDFLFGMALTVLGKNVLVGSPQFVGGRVYLFSPDGTILQTLNSPNREDLYFGVAVTSFGDNILAGAPIGDPIRNRSNIDPFASPRRVEDVEVQRSCNAPVNRRIDHGGYAYLFAPDGTHLKTFRAPDAQAGANFGAPLKVLGEIVLVGAPNHDTEEGENVGQVYLFAPDGTYLRTFRAPDRQAGASFGAAVSVLGENVLVGALYHDTEEGENVGQVYLFAPDGTHLRTFRAPDAQAGAQFGGLVAGSGERIIVGAPFHDTDAGRNAGRVYIFSGHQGNQE